MKKLSPSLNEEREKPTGTRRFVEVGVRGRKMQLMF